VRNISNGGPNPASTGHEHGNGINIIPTHPGTNDITADVSARDGSASFRVTVTVHVIDCGPVAKAVGGAKIGGVRAVLHRAAAGELTRVG
jgi:hypothetical protein